MILRYCKVVICNAAVALKHFSVLFGKNVKLKATIYFDELLIDFWMVTLHDCIKIFFRLTWFISNYAHIMNFQITFKVLNDFYCATLQLVVEILVNNATEMQTIVSTLKIVSFATVDTLCYFIKKII
ncbi:hypothetical protein T01_10362 [Trichinella spiralis]|uniref:Uncharacterized protein n=1 Tax=Trichinella spiralis TaxID=6334 RepID=A0A0V1BWZ1_TRISP|nr:hypothetical protein T01_10362 [Trichinella spiralis]